MDTTTGQIKTFKDAEELSKAIASGDWVKLDKMPNPKCTRCYGLGHTGRNLNTGKYVPCRCVKDKKQETKPILGETAPTIKGLPIVEVKESKEWLEK